MKLAIFFIFPVLLILAGRESTMADNPEKKPEPEDKYYRLISPQISEDGKWLLIRKLYALNRDTLLLFNNQSPGQPVISRAEAGRTFFTGKTGLLIQKPQCAELFKLNGLTSTYFPGAKSIEVLKDGNYFVLHYNEKQNNRLELRDSNGELLNVLDNVNRFYKIDNSILCSVAENSTNSSSLVRVTANQKQKLYTSRQKITSIDIDSEGQGIIIHMQAAEDGIPTLVFLDLNTLKIYLLPEWLSGTFRRAFVTPIGSKNSYFLKLYTNENRTDTPIVDIWYGNDNKLDQKFYPQDPETCYLWKPHKKQIKQIGTDSLSQNTNIGNTRFFLSFDPYLFQDYTGPCRYKINIYNRPDDDYSPVDTISEALHVSPNGLYLLYSKNKTWYTYLVNKGLKRAINIAGLQTPYFYSNGREVLFKCNTGFLKYDLKTNSQIGPIKFRQYKVSFLNTHTDVLNKFNFYRKTLDYEKPLLIQLYDSLKNENTVVMLNKGNCKIVIPPTSKRIQNLVYNREYSHLCYTEEDYNLPPRLVHKEMGDKEQVIYQSNPTDKTILSVRQEIISYINSDGTPLKGILYYPLHYNSLSKHPMIVHIYETQNQLRNKYLLPSHFESLGFNIRLFIENDYFVYLPDIIIRGKDGPGMNALDCVNHALDAVSSNLLIDKSKIGLIGHSFGGYETDFIATASNRFKTYVSGSGHSDIVWAAQAFNYNFLFPDYMRIEANMYKLKGSFFENKALYLRNSPLYHAEKVNAPILLWSGTNDQNVTSDHTMAFYNALRRNKKKVVALFYPEEGHALLATQAKVDLTSRIMDWFNYFLKDEREIEWINNNFNAVNDKRIKKGINPF